jgi:protein-tyrosine-phosphatase
MAEGLAKAAFGDKVFIQSAGSKPSKVNPFAIKALAEIGIDISKNRSKSVDEIDPSTVDTVITLCAEEECPIFLGKAERLHWGLPDPASAQGTDEEKLVKFREIRDEIRKRIRDQIHLAVG